MTGIENKVNCNFCDSKRTSKAGFVGREKKRQRYYCRDCRRFFRVGAVYPKQATSYAPKLDLLPNDGQLISELRQIARVLGKTPTTNDITRLSKQRKSQTLQNYYAVFGSYVDAVKAAKLKQHYKQEFDKEKLLAELRTLGKSFKRPIFARDVDEARRKRLVSPPFHFQRAFGSVANAIESAGVNKKYPFDDNYLPRNGGEYLPRARQYSREELISHLKNLKLKIGHIPRINDVNGHYKKDVRPSYKAYINEFGSLSSARKAARIPSIQWQKYSRTTLIEQLRGLGVRLGRKPTDRDIVRASIAGETASVQVFTKNFGSLINAYEAASFETLKPREYSDKEIIKRLRKLRHKLGKRIGFKDLYKASIEGWCPSPNTVYRRIGNIDRIERVLNR